MVHYVLLLVQILFTRLNYFVIHSLLRASLVHSFS